MSATLAPYNSFTRHLLHLPREPQALGRTVTQLFKQTLETL